MNSCVYGAFNRNRYVMNKMCKAYLVTFGENLKKFYVVENHPESWFKQCGIYARPMTKEMVPIYVDGIDGYKEYTGWQKDEVSEDFIKLFEACNNIIVKEGDTITFNNVTIEVVPLPRIDVKASIKSGEWNRHDCLAIYINGETVTKEGDVYRSKRGIVEVHTMSPFKHINTALTTLLQDTYDDKTITVSINKMVKENDCCKYTVLTMDVTAKSTDIVKDILAKYFFINIGDNKVEKLEEVTIDGWKAVKVVVHLYDCYEDVDYSYEY